MDPLSQTGPEAVDRPEAQDRPGAAQDAVEAGTARDTAPPEAGAASLDDLLNHLQGNVPGGPADAGLSRFGERRLAEIQRCAAAQSQRCARAVRSLTRVLALLLEERDASARPWNPADLAALGWHVHDLALDRERWGRLADNAAYLRSHHAEAHDIGRQWTQQAMAAGEWP
jgi:hypothetical protein